MYKKVWFLTVRFVFLFTAQCAGPLGMETGEIPDSDITASSSFDAGNVGPQNGR